VGATWEAVGARLHRSPETCRRWPQDYAPRWRALTRAAEDRLFTEAGSEALVVLRRLLRNADPRVCRDPAKFLLGLRVRLRRAEDEAPAAPDGDAARIVAFLGRLSDAEVRALAAELVARLVPPAGGTAADAPVGPTEPAPPKERQPTAPQATATPGAVS
jgi:hypothetical protein